MTQPSNNITTLFIADPNGGQPQMIKVMGGAKIPIQLASSGSSVSTSAIKNFIKTTAGTNNQSPTVIPAGKIQNRQILALPTKQNINFQSIRGPVMVPVNNMQLKQNIPVVNPVRMNTNVISSPMVIRTQTGNLAVATSQSATSTQNHIQLPSINVSKQTSANVATANLQGPNSGLSLKPAPFTIKSNQVQQHAATNKPSEIFFVQQKMNQNTNQQKASAAASLSQIPQTKPLQQLQHHQQVSQGLQSVNSSKSLMNTSILDHSGNRKRHDFDFEYGIESKRRRPEKGGKGLRHFSMKVCEKVQAKGTTTYNEVADELVSDFTESSRSHSPTDGVNYDQKNIRRRVYDALNVLMAMNIISKEKKEIRWIGLPTNSLQECHKLEQEKRKRLQQIKKKTQQLQHLILQQIAFKNLVERNKNLEKENGPPAPNSAIQLPFIIVNTSKKTVIDCSISNDKTEYVFNFDNTFEIHDDIEVLKRMGMALGLDKGACSPADLEKAKSLVPKNLESYVVDLAEGRSLLNDDEMMREDDLTVGNGLDAAAHERDFDLGAIGATVEMGADDHVIKEEGCSSSLSRHSSLLSLHGGQRTDSCSPSSFGDDYDVDLEDSDVEIS